MSAARRERGERDDMMALSTELRLLLLAAGGESNREPFRRLALQGFDWASLTTMSAQANVVLALWRQIAEIPELRDAIEAQALNAIAILREFRLAHIGRDVERIAALLGENGIEILLLKGAAHLAGAMRAPVSRSMGDIDLMVMNGSAQRAWEICREAGWELGNAQWSLELYAEHHHLPPLMDPRGARVGLEVHRSLLALGSPRLIDEAGMRSRARRLAFRGTSVFVPSLEDMLMHASVHYAWSHEMGRGALQTFVDAHAIVGEPGFSWTRFVDMVQNTRGAACSYWMLRLAKHATLLEVPDNVLADLRPSIGERSARALERHFLSEVFGRFTTELPLRLRHALWTFAFKPRKSGFGGSRPWLTNLDVPLAAGRNRATPSGSLPPLARSVSAASYVSRLVGLR